jgi:molybdate transport system substrate-binding protein
MIRSWAAVVVTGVLVLGCGRTGTVPADRSGVELTVYAAASLREAVASLEDVYRRTSPGFRLAVSLDASSTLRAQIEQGAPADLFLSADVEEPKRLADAGLASAPRTFATNRLVIVVPRTGGSAHGGIGSRGVRDPADLGRPGVRIVGAGPDVPISRYAAELLGKLAALPDIADDLPARYEANVVTHEDNVRAALAKIELGEGDAAIVYRTDALASERVATIELPEAAQVTVSYAGVVIARSPSSIEAGRFLDWIASPAGSANLAPLGFGRP